MNSRHKTSEANTMAQQNATEQKVTEMEANMELRFEEWEEELGKAVEDYFSDWEDDDDTLVALSDKYLCVAE